MSKGPSLLLIALVAVLAVLVLSLLFLIGRAIVSHRRLKRRLALTASLPSEATKASPIQPPKLWDVWVDRKLPSTPVVDLEHGRAWQDLMPVSIVVASPSHTVPHHTAPTIAEAGSRLAEDDQQVVPPVQSQHCTYDKLSAGCATSDDALVPSLQKLSISVLIAMPDPARPNHATPSLKSHSDLTLVSSSHSSRSTGPSEKGLKPSWTPHYNQNQPFGHLPELAIGSMEVDWLGVCNDDTINSS